MLPTPPPVPPKHQAKNNLKNNPDCIEKIRICSVPGDNLLIRCCAAVRCEVQVAHSSRLKVPLLVTHVASALWDLPKYCSCETQELPTPVQQGFVFQETLTYEIREQQSGCSVCISSFPFCVCLLFFDTFFKR